MNEPVDAIKQRLRAELRSRRARIDPARVEAGGKAIATRLATLDVVAEATIVHVYVDSLPGEVPTRAVIEAALQRGARVVCPRVATHDPPRLETVEITSLDDLTLSGEGLWEPDPGPGRRLDPDRVEVVLAPGLGFDRDGNRLGLGGGFYDAFLAPLSAPRVGLAFSLQVLDSIPHTPHDERVDLIVTEEQVIDCRRARRSSQQDSPT